MVGKEIDFSPFELVPFDPSHEKALIDLIASCYAEYGQKIELDTLDSDLTRIEEVYQPPGSLFRVLLENKKLVGSVAVKHLDGPAAEIKRLFVNPACRGQGLGKKLSLWVYHCAASHGCQSVDIWSDVLYETAHSLYRGLGTEDTGRRRSLGGVNDVDEFHFIWRIA